MSSFADLRQRVVSAIGMVLVGAGAIWLGGAAFLGLLAVVAGLMIWELARMLTPALNPSKAILLGLIGSGAVVRVGYDTQVLSLIALLLAPVVGLVLIGRGRWLFLGYGTALLFAVAGLFWLRNDIGLAATVWLVAVVIASDIGGYFFGRILGGPKILPRISPKKTWSGTLGGWLLAAGVGLGFVIWTGVGTGLIVLSILAAIAAQVGDVVESAIKRATGVKDSSNLIPGHGGFLDRFDALIAASLFVLVITNLTDLPIPGGF